MSKLQDIRNLVQEHAVSVSSSPGDWMDYMDTASRLYRYSFSDQLLIHAQRPDATACASLELWNEKMLRWVNRGARGIALFDETWQNTKLHYVFDISDTHMVAGGRSPYLWKMQEHQREEILTHLAEVYALEEKDAATLQDALMAVAREMVNDNLEEYLDGLEYAVEGTYLEDLDEVTIRSDFRQLATDSVYYLLSRRCGLDPMELLEEEDFMHITDYNRLSVLTFLGNAASQLSESILIDIGKTVHKISLEEARKEVEKSNERNYNNFTTLIREIKNQDAETKKEENIENEGGNDYGTDISSQGRLPVSESDRRRGRSDDREIWDAAEDISERTQEQPLSEPVPDREAEQPSGTDRESSTGENGQPDGEITGEESGTGQGSRSDGMDSTHERTDGNSGREHLDGIGIQLVEDTREDGLSKAEEEIASALSLPEYPTANEQRRQIEERTAALYAGEIPIPEEVVDEILRTGGNRKASQLRIIYNFMSEQTPEEYTEFVKREYRKGGKGFQIDGNEYSVWFDETGMQIAVGHTVTDHILDNELNAHGIAMEGIKVDINPIAEKRITLAEYMKEADAYLDQQEIKKLAVDLDNFSYEYDTYEYKDTVENREEQVEKITEDILNKKTECLKDWLVEVSEESDIDSDVITARSLLSRLEGAERFSIFDKQPEQEQPEATISFYVAECMEFSVMGEYHNNLTLEEAIKIYESIPAERLHGIKGIGFDLQDGDEDYSGEYGLMSGDRIDRDLIDMIPHYKESPLVQKAINDMEKYLNEKHGKVQEAEQTVEVKQEVPEASVKKESVSVEPNREQNKEPAKGGKGELKKSVLQSLKEFQVRAKAQEQKETATEKSKARKKGEVEL